MSTPEELAKMIENAGGTVESGAALPDGSGFMTASFPLPKDHWIYGSAMRPPMPMRTGTDHPRRRELNDMVRQAAQHAVKASTRCGRDEDFDPDALVQNMIIGLLGYHTGDGLDGDDSRYDPKTVPPLFSWPDASKTEA